MFKSQTLVRQQHLIEQLTRENEQYKERLADLESKNDALNRQIERLASAEKEALDSKAEREQRLEEAIDRHEKERDVLSSAKSALERRYASLLKFFGRFRSVVHKRDNGQNVPQEEELSEMGRELDQILEQVDDFRRSVSTIKKISDQLELLGVNATIQAAHAGEKGKGFLIVADEINKLSYHSKRSVEEALRQLTLFTEITRGLSRDFSRTVESIEGNLDAFNELHALFEEHAPKEIKEYCETSDRM